MGRKGTGEVSRGRGDETGFASVAESTTSDDEWAALSGGDVARSGQGREYDEGQEEEYDLRHYFFCSRSEDE